MNKIKVLYIVTDFHSGPSGGKLALGEEIRAVQKKVRTAKHGEALELHVHWEVRVTELLDMISEVQPDVLHFSGHGGPDGISLVGEDGHSPHRIRGDALAALLNATGSHIRLVVLSADQSLSLAEAVTTEPRCVIGIRRHITDRGARTFNATFYGALASGYSVKTAFDHARAEMKLDDFGDFENIALVAGPGLDPAHLMLLADNDPNVGSDKPVPHIVVFPTVFTIPPAEREHDLVSVMMPFSAEFNRTYQAIEKACTNTGLRCRRADTVWKESTVIQEVFNLIYQSAVIVADLSERNGNVMYECGIAHTLGRPVVPISRSKDATPFDVAHHRILHYLPNSQGHTQMRKQLESRLRSLTGQTS